MALLTDTVTIVALQTDMPNIVQPDANAPQYHVSPTPPGWALFKFQTDGMLVWRPIQDATTFAALTIGQTSTVSFG